MEKHGGREKGLFLTFIKNSPENAKFRLLCASIRAKGVNAMVNAQESGEGREERLQRLMQTYGNALVGLCTGILGDSDLAQDVVQETFMSAYRSLDSLRAEHAGSERAWLTRIAVNRCASEKRSRWFRSIVTRETMDELPAAPQADEETADALYEAVRRLPDRERTVILLHYMQDMPVEEIAEALGLSPSAVYRRLETARRRLKQMLEGGDIHG